MKQIQPKMGGEQTQNRASTNEYPDAPRVGVGCVVVKDGAILLIRRGKPPAIGEWTVPGGSVGLGEPLRKAAEREVLEETGVSVRARAPVDILDLIETDAQENIRFHYVIVDFEADYRSGTVRAGDDALDARWVSPRNLSRLKISTSTLKLLKKVGFIF